RAVPARKPRRRNVPPKAIAAAQPETKTNMCAASERPKRAGIASASQFPGTWATKMISSDAPRKKSRRTSRVFGGAAGVAVVIAFVGGPELARRSGARPPQKLD